MNKSHTPKPSHQSHPSPQPIPFTPPLHAGGVTSPIDFKAGALHCGIKRKRKDLALLYSKRPLTVAGVFTTNQVKAAPVLLGQAMLEQQRSGKRSGSAKLNTGESTNAPSHPIHGVLVNSGNANACTGEQGMQDAKTIIRAISQAKGFSEPAFLMGSTGVIGVPLPMEPIVSHLDKLVESLCGSTGGSNNFAKGIMTTDTFPKQVATTVTIGETTITIGGAAKGSGMIHPNMATMLAYVTTDAHLSPATLQMALEADVQDTYNMISVDGDTSTNDTLLLMANGAAGGAEILPDTPEYEQFCKALHQVNLYLAKSIVRDGEGATKLVTIRVSGADTKEHARKLARSVSTSNLTKTALFGEDANWGRILCALGYAGVDFDPMKVSVALQSAGGSIELLQAGAPVDFSEKLAATILAESEVTIAITMGQGTAKAVAYGCDLSYEYVRINGDYRS